MFYIGDRRCASALQNRFCWPGEPFPYDECLELGIWGGGSADGSSASKSSRNALGALPLGGRFRLSDELLMSRRALNEGESGGDGFSVWREGLA